VELERRGGELERSLADLERRVGKLERSLADLKRKLRELACSLPALERSGGEADSLLPDNDSATAQSRTPSGGPPKQTGHPKVACGVHGLPG
jgi:chromosome segregation ATPase